MTREIDRSTLVKRYDRAPSATLYTLRALTRDLFAEKQTQRNVIAVPPIELHWHRFKVSQQVLESLSALTELELEACALLAPHVAGFRLVMAILTSDAFPITIQRSLQTRNHLLRHGTLRPGHPYDLKARTVSSRVIERGLEVDIHVTLTDGGALIWESLLTFFYRGSFGEADQPSVLAKSPPIVLSSLDNWRMPDGKPLLMGYLTGDFNPLHFSNWYARARGAQRAFFHPPHAIGLCLSRLGPLNRTGRERLDMWLKGPVPYGALVRLSVDQSAQDTTFALALEEEARPCLVGRWVVAQGPLFSPEGETASHVNHDKQGSVSRSGCQACEVTAETGSRYDVREVNRMIPDWIICPCRDKVRPQRYGEEHQAGQQRSSSSITGNERGNPSCGDAA